MKKLLALTILFTVSLAKPCFGVDWLRDRIYYSLSFGATGLGHEIGYHYTDNTKIAIRFIGNNEYVSTIAAKFQYHHKFTSTDITPYINVSTGIVKVSHDDITDINISFVPYQIGAGINLPLCSITSVFAGYSMRKFYELSHEIELGISFNL